MQSGLSRNHLSRRPDNIMRISAYLLGLPEPEQSRLARNRQAIIRGALRESFDNLRRPPAGGRRQGRAGNSDFGVAGQNLRKIGNLP
jgi:hypothetical protein